jgi:recombination protein RecR
MDFPSRLLSEAVEEFSRLPGIGKKTALRLVLHMLNQETEQVGRFSDAIRKLREETRFCEKCHNISDDELCGVCSDSSRKTEVVCVVESLRDVMAIENTNQYFGQYHVLGGVISPIDGVGPEELNIDSLVNRIKEDGVRELIMALNPTIEGDTTIFYLSKQLAPYDVTITTIARGISFGGELEYADELTLARSIVTRLPYENYLVNRE